MITTPKNRMLGRERRHERIVDGGPSYVADVLGLGVVERELTPAARVGCRVSDGMPKYSSAPTEWPAPTVTVYAAGELPRDIECRIGRWRAKPPADDVEEE